MQIIDWLARYMLIAAIPYFLISIAVELYALKRSPRLAGLPGYEWRDYWTSIALGSIKLVMMGLCGLYSFWLFMKVYEHHLLDLSPLKWWTWVLLFFADDFCYYWYHRFAHRVRLFWSEHVNHHSSERYNLGTALRQSTLEPVYGFIYWLPLAFLGFHPLAIAVQAGVSLLYQFWIHTETIGRMGWFEKFFNTPSHHRVHHGSNGIYIDKNYAGILIIWDKLFGTFQEERADVPVKYGLVTNIHTYRLDRVIFHEFFFMWRQAWNAKGWKHKLSWIFRGPEWSPTGIKLPADHPYWQTHAKSEASVGA
jgi:sterol desaturase/sphingolipid hydroxylase (fatty acid hydroxylase superfamily)